MLNVKCLPGSMLPANRKSKIENRKSKIQSAPSAINHQRFNASTLPRRRVRRDRRGMLGLVESDHGATRERDRRSDPPAFLTHRSADHVLLLQRLHLGFEVVAQQIEVGA